MEPLHNGGTSGGIRAHKLHTQSTKLIWMYSSGKICGKTKDVFKKKLIVYIFLIHSLKSITIIQRSVPADLQKFVLRRRACGHYAQCSRVLLDNIRLFTRKLGTKN